MEEILNAPAPEALLLPVDAYFADYPEERISGEAERRCRNGNSFASDGPEGVFRVYGESGEFLMLGRRADATMSTVKSFFAPQTR
jgi:tRNA pseudouridine55 synthase